MPRPRNTEEEKKEHARIRSARYYAAHPDRAKASSKRWRDKDREHVNSVSSAHAKQNREQYRAYCVARRTKKTEAGGSYTVEEWLLLCEFYGSRCLCCGKKRKLTADHVTPVSKRGTSNIDNIQPLCGPCNSSKGDKSTDYRGPKMQHNVFAYTSPGCNYPQYISVNREENGETSVIVRSAAWGDGTCGNTAAVVLSPEEFTKLARTLFSFACTGNA